MKTCVLLLSIVTFLLIEVIAECPPMDNLGKVADEGAVIYMNCVKFTCHNGGWSGVGCPVYHCVDEIGQTDYDNSKPYPECCPKPICSHNH